MGRILSAFLMLGISSMCGAQIYKYLGIEDGWLSLKPWGIALKFLFLHHENILFPND